MAKKELQAGKCYYISTDREENPKLGAKLLSDGRESLFLDFYFGYEMVYSSAKDRKEERALNSISGTAPEPHNSDRKTRKRFCWLRR